MISRMLGATMAVLLLGGCSNVQRGSLTGALIGAGAGAGIGAAGGGVGVAIGAGAGAGAGALMGGVAGEVYEVHRARITEEYRDDYDPATGKATLRTFNPASGEALVRTKTLAAYEKRLALMEARNRQLISQNERLIAAGHTFADKVGADGHYMRIETTPEGALQVSMVAEVLFEQGSAKLKEAIYPVLDQIGGTIGREYAGYSVAIEGHTDSGEAQVAGYRSAWELSAARALSVLHYFEDRKLVDPGRMAVAGYGPYRPVSDATKPEMNRRVVITLMPAGQPPLRPVR